MFPWLLDKSMENAQCSLQDVPLLWSGQEEVKTKVCGMATINNHYPLQIYYCPQWLCEPFSSLIHSLAIDMMALMHTHQTTTNRELFSLNLSKQTNKNIKWIQSIRTKQKNKMNSKHKARIKQKKVRKFTRRNVTMSMKSSLHSANNGCSLNKGCLH